MLRGCWVPQVVFISCSKYFILYIYIWPGVRDGDPYKDWSIILWSKEEDRTARNIYWFGFGALRPLPFLIVPEPAMGAEGNFTALHALAVPSMQGLKKAWKTINKFLNAPEGSFYSLWLAYCETVALKSWFSEFPTAQHLHERQHYECLGGTKLFLITLNSSHLFAKFASMQMLGKVSTDVD